MTETAQIITLPQRDTQSDWWRGGVIYQIYPRSYRDTTGNGIGDLPGITQKLPYIAELGVDAIWISPFFKSPMQDYGYDVSDYRDVDPMFGTLDDFDTLLDTAHRLGLKVMIDLVLSHSSDQHAWFTESRSSRDNPRSDWYVWADPKPDGTPPNNWLSIFGGSAWQWDARREQYYLHNFLTSQPDLNFHEPDVQDALLDVTRFWLDRGVDGFRLDTINFYVHDQHLRDNPALPRDQRNDTIAPLVNPYNHQEHFYSKNRPENLLFLERFRALLNEYDARACVGEIGDAQRGLELLGEYTAGQTRSHMCYAFEFLSQTPLTASRVKSVFEDFDAAASDGWACWAFSNHDVVRHPTRWGLSDAATRCYAALLQCLRGSVCLYQGEELGLGEADIAFEDIQDPYGKEFWPEFKGRDGCRTPMAWETQDEFGGFSNTKPWLPLTQDHADRAVNRQQQDDASVLNHYRRCIALRQDNPALRNGDQTGLCAQGDVLSFTRSQGAQSIFCAFNLSDTAATVDVPAQARAHLWQDALKMEALGDTMRLDPWHFALIELAT